MENEQLKLVDIIQTAVDTMGLMENNRHAEELRRIETRSSERKLLIQYATCGACAVIVAVVSIFFLFCYLL